VHESLPCPTILFRALRSAGWRSQATGEVLTVAFLLRPNEDGLSVGLTFRSAVTGLRKHHGCVTLHSGRVRDIGLVPLSLPLPDNADHAAILGLPKPDEDPVRAEDFARKLCEQARNVASDAR